MKDYDIQGYHASPVEAAQAANEANVKELIFYHLIPAPDSFIAKIIFVKGVSEVRPDNWTLADDGTFMVVEPMALDGLKNNIDNNPGASMFYGFGTLICVPASKAQPVGLGLGPQAGPKSLWNFFLRQDFQT